MGRKGILGAGAAEATGGVAGAAVGEAIGYQTGAPIGGTVVGEPHPGDRYMDLVRRHPLVAIEDDFALDRATEMINSLLGQYDPDANAYRKTLAVLIEEYEERAYPIRKGTPAELLRALMEAKEVNQSQVVAATGMPASTISEILAGKRGISPKNRATLAAYFKVEPAAFV